MHDSTTLSLLVGTALTIGFVHTLIGVDHTLPFVALGRARGWSLRRLLAITGLCGFAHVLTSVLIGAIAIAIGISMEWVGGFQELRGRTVSWLLIGLGLAYAAWSYVRMRRGRTHSHAHTHADGSVHAHGHDHQAEHLHPHLASNGDRGASSGVSGFGNATTVWGLFILFALGPCEALIPILMVPAAAHDWVWVVWVVGAFCGATVFTMLAVVGIAHAGLSRVRFGAVEPYAHTLAGLAIASSGMAIEFLGL